MPPPSRHRAVARATHLVREPPALPTIPAPLQRALRIVARLGRMLKRWRQDPFRRCASQLQLEHPALPADYLQRGSSSPRVIPAEPHACAAPLQALPPLSAAAPPPQNAPVQACERARRARGRRRLPSGRPPAAGLQRVLPVVARGPHGCAAWLCGCAGTNVSARYDLCHPQRLPRRPNRLQAWRRPTSPMGSSCKALRRASSVGSRHTCGTARPRCWARRCCRPAC